ncbi:hypothetical protein [Bacillus sp. D386]|uniref:hypothetical protein n=1 Tax=Bacillus sp. D386 TaxID=2587155 RepID=UPI001123BD0A|nr:hypothetical protein [Bacillus sp. D386]
MIFWGLISVAICLPGIYFMFQTEKRMPNNDDISDKESLIAHYIPKKIWRSLILQFKVHILN